jgi:hypothetical protein
MHALEHILNLDMRLETLPLNPPLELSQLHRFNCYEGRTRAGTSPTAGVHCPIWSDFSHPRAADLGEEGLIERKKQRMSAPLLSIYSSVKLNKEEFIK